MARTKPRRTLKQEAASSTHAVQWLELHPELAVGVLIAMVTLAHLFYAVTYALNPDEALQYHLAHRPSLGEAWRMNNTNAHPPFLSLALHFWRKIGTSELFLRLIPILSGAGFVWFSFGWARLVLGLVPALVFAAISALIPPVYAMSQELRQYMPMMLGIAAALYWFERAWVDRPLRNMAISATGLLVAVLSNYSAAWFAAGFGCYGLWRLARQPVASAARLTWALGQIAALATYAALYVTHLAKLRQSELAAGVQEGFLRRLYRQPTDSIADYLAFNMPGLVEYIFGSKLFAVLGVVLLLAGIVTLYQRRARWPHHAVPVALLLSVPALLWIGAALAGLYPLGGSRHCMLFAMLFAVPVSLAVAELARGRATIALSGTLAFMLMLQIVAIPEVRTQQLEAQRREHLREAVAYWKQQASRGLTFVDYQTSLLLCYYSNPQHMCTDQRNEHFLDYQMDGGRVAVSRNWSLHPTAFVEELRELKRIYQLPRGAEVWVIDGGWGEPLHRMLQVQYSGSALPGLRAFGGSTGVFRVPN
ncbi:MAG: glycosyltransferase family 39 protein [Bryobacterales bacterium]|nr:glycosyltransferase family 39 protein [Bryobacterales bacterium]